MIKGSIDLLYVVLRSTPELIEKTIAETMEIAKPNGGFIIGSSDCFREGMPKKISTAIFKRVRSMRFIDFPIYQGSKSKGMRINSGTFTTNS